MIYEDSLKEKRKGILRLNLNFGILYLIVLKIQLTEASNPLIPSTKCIKKIEVFNNQKNQGLQGLSILFHSSLGKHIDKEEIDKRKRRFKYFN